MEDKEWVDGALRLVIDTIASTAAFPMSDEIRRLYDCRYRKDFEKHTEAEWIRDQDCILVLARLVGVLAASLTTIKSASQFEVPDELDLKSADRAGYLVANMEYCPVPADPTGVWCDNYETTDGDLFKPAAALFQAFVTAL